MVLNLSENRPGQSAQYEFGIQQRTNQIFMNFLNKSVVNDDKKFSFKGLFVSVVCCGAIKQ